MRILNKISVFPIDNFVNYVFYVSRPESRHLFSVTENVIKMFPFRSAHSFESFKAVCMGRIILKIYPHTCMPFIK